MKTEAEIQRLIDRVRATAVELAVANEESKRTNSALVEAMAIANQKSTVARDAEKALISALQPLQEEK